VKLEPHLLHEKQQDSEVKNTARGKRHENEAVKYKKNKKNLK
jgi:hypothetical protein